jgi:hypothetical protein
MKRIIISVLLAAAVFSASYARKVVAVGQTYTQLGTYRIELADQPVKINGEECKTFVITYQNSPLEVKVVVTDGSKCKKYIVLSDKLSVQYVCNENYFGVEKIDRKLEKEGFKTADSELNRSAYFHQKVLTPGKRGETEAAMLIAAYFPYLLNNNETTASL